MHLDISELTEPFPAFRVAVVLFEGLAIGHGRPASLEAAIAAREAEARTLWQGKELSEIPAIAAWRQAYRAFGIKKTSYRSSVERLMKNVLAERALPVINPFVDAYNAVSLTHVLPIGADDLDRITGDIAFRYARPGDSFLDMAGGDNGAEGSVEDPPKPGEVVYADAEKVLCRRWNWRQDARSLVSGQTRRAVVTIQATGVGSVEAAAADLISLIAAHCGGTACFVIADRAHPRAEIAG
ncbi:B3/B4 domain-containing protein (DNA/RNA-binding domain of Phe-tRNA-synthetase) [Kaistia soli DSM 19436]|uniref:B3/B4 domain-containing protein (DNA/RNA-binding domain of Phe-tRNA-synthetase) n=1 Tax=Kaistia soli DSM 19436 TaxID=1122133 RepID=A0A1M4ZTI9_9HYPH|nr:phenylalanine--tRNA ligase beta subunit-related protein [Kaistia soli]SHF21314.1 B3/B4 domain-containing protein (DNA/RNA-binding domain of Phe-tRNA-synthetase) [Kaistia soli DSM 19436]